MIYINSIIFNTKNVCVYARIGEIFKIDRDIMWELIAVITLLNIVNHVFLINSGRQRSINLILCYYSNI